MSAQTMIPLQKDKNLRSKWRVFPWANCLPFVENSRGMLIHRPRSGATYNIHKAPHVGIGFWCGMHIASDGKNLTFLASPPDGRIVCERCEKAAIESGLPSSDDLAGRHVHKGRTVAVSTCCVEKVGAGTTAKEQE